MSPSEYSVIVVEDGEDEILLLQRAFQDAKLKSPVLVFRDGQEVIDYLRQLGTDGGKHGSDAPPALMLLDLKMPRKNGLDVLEWLRLQPGLKRLATVVMSSSGHASDINRAYDMGCSAYLTKPMSYGELVDLVRLIDGFWLLQNQKPDLRSKLSPG